jgi:anti-sigma factor RsiW
MIRWTCRRLRPLLVDHASGGLPAADARRVDAHVDACAACRADLAAMRSVEHVLRAGRAVQPDEDFWRRQRQSIMRRVRTAPETPAPVLRPTWRLAGALATILLSIVVGRSVVHRARHVPHTVERLDDEALVHLHDVLPALAPASSIEDAESDLLSVHDLGDEELDSLAALLDDAS